VPAQQLLVFFEQSGRRRAVRYIFLLFREFIPLTKRLSKTVKRMSLPSLTQIYKTNHAVSIA